MNWLVGAVIIFLGLYVFAGYRNGFIKTVCAVVAVFLAMIVASVASPILSKTLQSNETVYDYFTEKVSSTLDLENKVEGVANQINAINKLPLPESLKESLIENNNKDIQSSLNVSTFNEYISGYVACMILNAISYVILFIVTLIVVKIIAGVLDIVSKLPILNGINKIGGLAVGLIHGLVILWVMCVVLTMFSATGPGKMLFELINESSLLSFIYNNNFLTDVVIGVAKTLLLI